MISFVQTLNESSDVVAHLEHVEDLVLTGSHGIASAISVLESVGAALVGSSKSKINVTLKVDGAPSIFAGIDPTDGVFFVAKKSIFNKTPKVYKTEDEVRADTSGDLANKMSLALEYLPKLGIKGIIQGDFLYSHSDLKLEKIAGKSYVTFHPNTIVYAVPAGTPLSRSIMASKIGIVWHTMYTGKSFDKLKAVGGRAIAKSLHKSKDVWFIDATIQDLAGTASFTAAETEYVGKSLALIKKKAASISAVVLNEVSTGELHALIRMFNNSRIKGGKESGLENPIQHTKDLVDWITVRFDKEAASKSKPTAKAVVELKKKAALAPFAKYHINGFAQIFSLMNTIVIVKSFLIMKMDTIGSLSTFLKTSGGFQVTGQEGFVITDQLGKNAVKLVDRIEFSRANFSPEIIKGWDH